MSQILSSLGSDISPFFNGSTDSTGDDGGGGSTDNLFLASGLTQGVQVPEFHNVINDQLPNTTDYDSVNALANQSINVPIPQIVNDNSAGATNDSGTKVSQPASQNTDYLSGILNALGKGAVAATTAGVGAGNAFLQDKEQQQLITQQIALQKQQNQLTATQLQNPLYNQTVTSTITGNEKTVLVIIGAVALIILLVSAEK